MTLWWEANATERKQCCQIRGCSYRARWAFDAGGMGLMRICGPHGPKDSK